MCRRVDSVSSGRKLGQHETPKDLIFQSESEGWQRPITQLSRQVGGVPSYSAFLFYSNL